MARKDKPYLPLYVQDVLTDERLIECSAESHGVYLRLMCILHKQDKYGLLCLKQKHKQSESKFENFALMLGKQMPFGQKQIQDCLQELNDEGVICVDDFSLYQKRMVSDGELSLVRSNIGKTGGSSVTKQYGKSGFLYWIGDGEDKNKIGISVNVLNRLYRLRSDLGIKSLNIIDKIDVLDMGIAEDIALDFFNDCRDGEWVKIRHSDMSVKFALLKAKLKQKIQANDEANSDNEIEIKELGSERVKDVANEVWKDQIWKEQICMGLGMKMDELQKWLAMFNSSIASDKVSNFDKSAYKKMSRGWIQKQKQKGTVVETGLAKTSTAPTLTRL